MTHKFETHKEVFSTVNSILRYTSLKLTDIYKVSCRVGPYCSSPVLLLTPLQGGNLELIPVALQLSYIFLHSL